MAKWFSAALNAARSLQQPKGKPDQMLNTLRKQPGVKKEEMDFLRLDELFNGQDVITVDQLQSAIRDRLRNIDGVDNNRLIHTDVYSDYKYNDPDYAKRSFFDLNDTSLGGTARYVGSDTTKFYKPNDTRMLYENRIVHVPDSLTGNSYDIDSDYHFPGVADRMNIGHTRGGTGTVGPLQYDPDAVPQIDDAYILDEVQSDLMQKIQQQKADARESQRMMADMRPTIRSALSRRWNDDPHLRREEVIKLLRQMTQPRGKGKDVPGDLTVEHGEFVYGSGDRLLGTIGKDGFPDDELIDNAQSAFMGLDGEDFTKQFFVDGYEKDDGRMRSFIEGTIGEELPLTTLAERVAKEMAELDELRTNLPYQKSWPELLLKDAIQEAVARDVEQFGFLSGDEVAKRWHREGEAEYDGLKSFYDNRLVNSKLWKELGLPKPQKNYGVGTTTFEARTVPLSAEFKKRVREQGLPLFSLGALATYGPYQNQGALYEQGR